MIFLLLSKVLYICISSFKGNRVNIIFMRKKTTTVIIYKTTCRVLTNLIEENKGNSSNSQCPFLAALPFKRLKLDRINVYKKEFCLSNNQISISVFRNNHVLHVSRESKVYVCVRKTNGSKNKNKN